MHFQTIWDSCAQNKASEKLQKMQELWDSALNKTSYISKHARSDFLGLLCAEQGVGNLKQCTFRKFGTPVRRTKRQKSQNMHVQEFWDSCARDKTSEVSNKCHLCVGSEQNTCPSSQHSTCLASQQGRCIGSQHGTCLASQHQ